MNLVDSLLTWLTTATLRGSVLVGVVLLLQAVLGRWMPGRWRLALWLPVVLVLAAPLLPECPWSMEGSTVGRVTNSAWCCPSASRDCGLGAGDALVSSVSNRALTGWRVIAGCWLAGGAWFLVVVGWSYMRTLGQLRRAAVTPSAPLMDLLREAAEVVGLRRLPGLLVSERVRGPAVAGVFRPVLLLPAGFPGELSGEEARLVLEHELLHIRRHDLWKNWVFCFLQAVHWFNPVAWLAVNRMRFDCERACDEEVLARHGTPCLAVYGHALIKVASGCGRAEPQLGILPIAASPANLRARLRGMGHGRRLHPAWAVAWVCLIGAVTLAGATRSPSGLPQGVSFFGGGPSPAVARARSFMLPEVELHGTSIADAVKEVQRQSQAVDPEGRGVRIWLTPEAAASAQGQRVSVSLRQVSVWQALSTITSQAGLGMDGSGEVVCVKWPFVTLTWLVADAELQAMGLPEETDARAWLRGQGVEFPEGSSAQLHTAPATKDAPAGNRLTVRNSQENLQRVSALLGRAKAGAPRIPR